MCHFLNHNGEYKVIAMEKNKWYFRIPIDLVKYFKTFHSYLDNYSTSAENLLSSDGNAYVFTTEGQYLNEQEEQRLIDAIRRYDVMYTNYQSNITKEPPHVSDVWAETPIDEWIQIMIFVHWVDAPLLHEALIKSFIKHNRWEEIPKRGIMPPYEKASLETRVLIQTPIVQRECRIRDYMSKKFVPLEIVNDIMYYQMPRLGPLVITNCYRAMILTKNGLFGYDWHYYRRANRDKYFNINDSPILPYELNIDHVLSMACTDEFIMVLTKDGLFRHETRQTEHLLNDDIEYQMKDALSMHQELSIISSSRVNINDVLSVACGYNYAIILTRDGLLYGYGVGYSAIGILGVTHLKSTDIPVRIHLPEEEQVSSVVCGTHHTMVVTRNGRLYGWGHNDHGQLGLLHLNTIDRPMRVPIENVISVACGVSHTIVLTGNGLYGCGNNRHGQIGLRSHIPFTVKLTKIPIDNLIGNDPISFVSCGHFSTTFVSGGKVFMFGNISDRKEDRQPMQMMLNTTTGVLQVFHTNIINVLILLTMDGIFTYFKSSLRRIDLEIGHETMSKSNHNPYPDYDPRGSSCTICSKAAILFNKRQPKFVFCSPTCHEQFLKPVPWKSIYRAT